MAVMEDRWRRRVSDMLSTCHVQEILQKDCGPWFPRELQMNAGPGRDGETSRDMDVLRSTAKVTTHIERFIFSLIRAAFGSARQSAAWGAVFCAILAIILHVVIRRISSSARTEKTCRTKSSAVERHASKVAQGQTANSRWKMHSGSESISSMARRAMRCRFSTKLVWHRLRELFPVALIGTSDLIGYGG
jgi:hypothetical protein